MNIEHYIHPMLAYFHQHPFLGELLTFIIAFIEALPIIGTIVPGSVTMTFIGILAGTGSLSVTLTFWMAVFGAYCGDCIGFGFGHPSHWISCRQSFQSATGSGTTRCYESRRIHQEA